MKHIRIISRFDQTTGLGWHGWSFVTALANVPGLQIEAVITDHHISPQAKQALEDCCDKVNFWNKVQGLAQVGIYCDVLGQQPADSCLTLAEINMALSVFDSSKVPPQWIAQINRLLDMVIVPDAFVKDAYIASGLDKDVIVLPLVVRNLYAEGKTNHEKPCFGYIGSYEERKNVGTLLSAFREAFGEGEAFLRIHLSHGYTKKELNQLKLNYAQKNIEITAGFISRQTYEDLLRSMDCFVSLSGGEGFSLVPREFMHLGRPIMLSDAGAYKNIPTMDGILFIESNIPYAAHYPYIDDNCHGYFEFPYQPDVVGAFRHILSTLKKAPIFQGLKDYAALFSADKLRPKYELVVNPKNIEISAVSALDEQAATLFLRSTSLKKKYERKSVKNEPRVNLADVLSDKKRVARSINKHVVLANDGGFFSVFNRLVSILAHELEADKNSVIIPDWRISAMKEHLGHDQFVSFCYGRPEDGNIFLKIFKPLHFDIPIEAYNDPLYLRHQAKVRVDYNEEKEPDLTYIHAYKLYKRPDFQQWREMYHKYFVQHIALKDDLQKRIDDFKHKYFEGYCIIAAHVRHPSHGMEQPGGSMPTVELFKKIIDQQIEDAQKEQPKPIKIFIASDQDSVINFFKRAYGEDLICTNVTRTDEKQDDVYADASEREQKQEGFQIAHIVASDKSQWSTKMAEEVIFDTWLLAASDRLVHITSNVSTAVSYISPKVKMIYCE